MFMHVPGGRTICRGWIKHGDRGTRTQDARPHVSMGRRGSREPRPLRLHQATHSTSVRYSICRHLYIASRIISTVEYLQLFFILPFWVAAYCLLGQFPRNVSRKLCGDLWSNFTGT